MNRTDHATQNAITRTGAITDHRISRRATASTCRRCGTKTIRALDGDTCAFDVTCDATPISELGEALAVLVDRPTYDLTRTRTGLELEPRRAHHIARPRAYPVLVEHRCGYPLPAAADPDAERDARVEPPF